MGTDAGVRRLEVVGDCQGVHGPCSQDGVYYVRIEGCQHEPDAICVEHAQWYRDNDKRFFAYQCKTCERQGKIEIWLPRRADD